MDHLRRPPPPAVRPGRQVRTRHVLLYEVDFVAEDGIRWTYGYELSATRVEAEWLHSYPRGRRRVWLDGDASRDEEYDFPGGRIQDRARLARTTRPNALFLSHAGTDNHPQLTPIFHWFDRNLWWIDCCPRVAGTAWPQAPRSASPRHEGHPHPGRTR